MKALFASALTALVMVTAAWASNVTPAQFSALSKRVTKLEDQNAVMRRALAFSQKDNARVGSQTHALALRLDDLEASVADDEAYFEKCVSELDPVATYTVTVNSGGAPFSFDELSPPKAGEAPDYWVWATRDSSCFAAK